MKKNWLLVVAGFLAIALIGLVVRAFILRKDKPGALRISSTPKAVIFLDDIQVGMTPFFSDKIQSGEHTVRLVPEGGDQETSAWEGRVVVAANVLTVINRVLGATPSQASGEILSLEKLPSRSQAALAVVSTPDQAVIKINDETKFSPALIEDLPAGDYDVTVYSAGYEERTIVAHTVAGYKLTVNIQLAQEIEGIAEATASAEEGEVEGESDEAEEEEAETTPTPTKTTEAVEPPPKPYVKIKSTPTGWLRVRSKPSTDGESEELGKANPGEMFSYLDETTSGWYKIEYEGEEGWVSGVYADLIE